MSLAHPDIFKLKSFYLMDITLFNDIYFTQLRGILNIKYLLRGGKRPIGLI